MELIAEAKGEYSNNTVSLSNRDYALAVKTFKWFRFAVIVSVIAFISSVSIYMHGQYTAKTYIDVHILKKHSYSTESAPRAPFEPEIYK